MCKALNSILKKEKKKKEAKANSLAKVQKN
jgi:hypothetical protein